MKKTYIIPTLDIVKVHAPQLMAGSPGYGGTTDATSDNLSREIDLPWDEE